MFEKMKRKIKIATAVTIGAYLVLFLWLISPQWWVQIIEMLPAWADIITWALPFILGGVAYYFVILDTHNWIDNRFFKERKKVDNYIRNQLVSPCNKVSCARARILENEEKSLMNLFYTFIPSNDTDRERAFSYWGDYFITVNLSASSILGFVGALIAVVFDFSRIIHPAFFIILAFLILFNLARVRSRKKLLYPAEAQTIRILSASYNDLKRRLPNYRSQCHECPLSQ